MKEYVLLTSRWCERATLEKSPYARFFKQPVTPAARCSFMVGTLITFVNFSETSRMRFDRVSSSPKKSAST